MVDIEFTSDFATKKKGDKFNCDSSLASHLINVDKVAKYMTTEKVKEEVKTKK